MRTDFGNGSPHSRSIIIPNRFGLPTDSAQPYYNHSNGQSEGDAYFSSQYCFSYHKGDAGKHSSDTELQKKLQDVDGKVDHSYFDQTQHSVTDSVLLNYVDDLPLSPALSTSCGSPTLSRARSESRSPSPHSSVSSISQSSTESTYLLPYTFYDPSTCPLDVESSLAPITPNQSPIWEDQSDTGPAVYKPIDKMAYKSSPSLRRRERKPSSHEIHKYSAWAQEKGITFAFDMQHSNIRVIHRSYPSKNTLKSKKRRNQSVMTRTEQKKHDVEVQKRATSTSTLQNAQDEYPKQKRVKHTTQQLSPRRQAKSQTQISLPQIEACHNENPRLSRPSQDTRHRTSEKTCPSMHQEKKAPNTSATSNVAVQAARTGPKRCGCCGTTNTPLWRDLTRELPLCNACGIRFKKYGLICQKCNYVPCKQERDLPCCKRCRSSNSYIKLPKGEIPT
eukprot:gene409-3755_t